MTMLDSITLSMTRHKQRQQYRSQMGIMIDILQVCMDAGSEGTLITKISRYANLSHYATSDNCKKLVDAGLIESTRVAKNVIYKVTDKGINFFHEIQKFQHLIKEVKIRL